MKKRYKVGIFVVAFALLVLQIGALPMTLPQAARLQKDVLLAPYSVWDYEIHKFDCSNMAALLHDNLQTKGWNVSIAEGDHPDRIYGHAWVEINGKPIDAKMKLVCLGAKPIFNHRYPRRSRYNSVEEMKDTYLNKTLAENEYGYEKYLLRKRS